MIISSKLLNAVIDPLTYEQLTVNHPVLLVKFVIVNSANLEASSLVLTLKCPFIVDVESSIVFKKDVISVAASLLESMYNAVAELNATLLNLNFPVPGSELAVEESKV